MTTPEERERQHYRAERERAAAMATDDENALVTIPAWRLKRLCDLALGEDSEPHPAPCYICRQPYSHKSICSRVSWTHYEARLVAVPPATEEKNHG